MLFKENNNYRSENNYFDNSRSCSIFFIKSNANNLKIEFMRSTDENCAGKLF